MAGEDTLRSVPITFDSRLRSTYSKSADLPPPPLFDPKLLESKLILRNLRNHSRNDRNYILFFIIFIFIFEDHGTSSTTSDETTGGTPLRPIRTAPPPPSTPPATSTNEQFLVPLEIPTISSPPRRSLYETTTELVKNRPYSSSSSYRTKIRPSVAPPTPPVYPYNRNPQSSQSLVDLIAPPSLQYQRCNSTGKALPIETSM